MFKSNSLLFNESAPWDPYCVRNFLNIPEDQLNLISNIPEWSAKDNEPADAIPIITVEENNYKLKDSDRNVQNSEITQKEVNLSLFDKNFEIRREALNAFVSERKKPLLTRSFSFCNTDEFNKLLKNNCKLKRSSSVPSIHQTSSVLYNLESHYHKTTKVLSLEHSKLKFLSPELNYTNPEGKTSLNKTYTISALTKCNSQCSVNKKREKKLKLSRHLYMLSENIVSVNNKMSEIGMKQITQDNDKHDSQLLNKSPESEGDAIRSSKVSDNNITCQALREISPSNKIAVSEIANPKENPRHSFGYLKDEDPSQKENAEVLNACHVEKEPKEKCSNSQSSADTLDSIVKENTLHISQDSFKLGESKDKQSGILCASNSSNIYLDESMSSQAIPCGQQPPDIVNTTHSLIVDDESLVKVPNKSDFPLSNEPQTSSVQDVPEQEGKLTAFDESIRIEQGSVLLTEKEHAGTTSYANDTGKILMHEKKLKSNQKKRKSSNGKKVKGLRSVKYARGADEISFSNSQLEKMLNLMKIYLDA